EPGTNTLPLKCWQHAERRQPNAAKIRRSVRDGDRRKHDVSDDPILGHRHERDQRFVRSLQQIDELSHARITKRTLVYISDCRAIFRPRWANVDHCRRHETLNAFGYIMRAVTFSATRGMHDAFLSPTKPLAQRGRNNTTVCMIADWRLPTGDA